MELEVLKLSINMKAREWCLLPYPDHPKGCPNYNNPTHEGICPPSAPLITDFIDIERPMYLIVEEFDLAAHVEKYKTEHTGCTDRQAKCVLYWQNGVRSRLKKKCEAFKRLHPGFVTTLCPEAMGVNVIATAQAVGIPIKPKPDGMVYKIALAGVPNGKGSNSGIDELLPSNFITTYTGLKFHYLSPSPDEINITDIAHALSLKCRFGGHCSHFFSVGEHSIRVAEIVPYKYRLLALLHDTTEAYMPDIPRPIKEQFGLRKYEDIIWKGIRRKFNLGLAGTLKVKEADDILLATEARDLMPNMDGWAKLPDPLPDKIKPMKPRTVEALFLYLYKEYIPK